MDEYLRNKKQDAHHRVRPRIQAQSRQHAKRQVSDLERQENTPDRQTHPVRRTLEKQSQYRREEKHSKRRIERRGQRTVLRDQAKIDPGSVNKLSPVFQNSSQPARIIDPDE